ncbi:MAG TPA: DNA-processing protein DprA, partial [Ignavibacteriaceae bacterium]
MTKLSPDKLTDLFSLLSVDGIGPGKIRNLLAKFRNTHSILSADYISLLKVEGISTNLARRIQQVNKERKRIKNEVESELESLNKIGGSIVTVWDENFPDLLKKIYDPPLILEVKGDFTNADDYSLAIVGTRMPTNYGKIQTERLASEFARQNITIISGMARGIDSIAHSAALKNNGRTIAVIGSGLDVIYPPENKKLYEKISENGVIVSEFRLGTKPDAQNFPRRNRLISGLSLGTIVVETGIEGGAMQTAALALDQNREVLAVPGNLGVKQSDGTNLLIQKGEASLIRSAEDVLIALELKLKPVLGKNIPRQQISLSLFEEKIMNVLNSEPLQIDKIA